MAGRKSAPFWVRGTLRAICLPALPASCLAAIYMCSIDRMGKQGCLKLITSAYKALESDLSRTAAVNVTRYTMAAQSVRSCNLSARSSRAAIVFATCLPSAVLPSADSRATACATAHIPRQAPSQGCMRASATSVPTGGGNADSPASAATPPRPIDRG